MNVVLQRYHDSSQLEGVQFHSVHSLPQHKNSQSVCLLGKERKSKTPH